MAIENIGDDGMLAIVFQSERAVLFKHSAVCSISAAAMREIQQFSDGHPDVDVYLLEVREQRPLSQKVVEHFGIAHESPQAIVIQHGKVSWQASHFDITAGLLASAVAGG